MDGTPIGDEDRESAEQGYADAQVNLGLLYDRGRGVAKDDAEAVRWYREAAAKGHAMAQNNLGAKYLFGEGVPKNKEEAVRWFRMAAEQGNAKAKATLKEMGISL